VPKRGQGRHGKRKAEGFLQESSLGSLGRLRPNHAETGRVTMSFRKEEMAAAAKEKERKRGNQRRDSQLAIREDLACANE